MMHYEHASDWSWARGSCSGECGLVVTSELSASEAKAISVVWSRRMRRMLREQIAAEMRRLGCPHVDT